MPVYIYEHPDTGETKNVFQLMADKHEYAENGVAWKRVWCKPQASFNTHLDPFSQSDYVNKLHSTKGNMADAWERSAELSDQRADKAGGVDPVKEKHFENYSKIRHGAKHPKQVAGILKDAVIKI